MIADSESTDAGWQAVEAAFSALGRVMLLLDANLRVVRATRTLDAWVCPNACSKIVGQPATMLLGEELFSAQGTLRASLEAGTREEGRRAFVRCEAGVERLASLSVAPLGEGAAGKAWTHGAKFLLVLRPSEEDELVLQGALAFQGIVGRSPALLRIVHLIDRLHRSEATVLLTGESGTGKEVVARAIHASSPRHAGPFVALNCGAIPGELLESELFGSVKGAFTNAVRDRVGRFEAASGGTIFLDEIGDLPLPLQVKLLRVLQERTFDRVGESVSRPMTARIVAATNVDLKEAIAAGRLREDLYYRLHVIPIHLPPLRERTEDIEPLARHLLARACARAGRAVRFSPDILTVLERYEWPGNVRELENAIEYAVATSQRQTIGVDDLPSEISAAIEGPASDETKPAPIVGEDVARLRAILDKHRWHHAHAAAELGISRTTLWRKMRAFGLS